MPETLLLNGPLDREAYAEISLVVSDIEDPTTWVVVLDVQGEELAVKISETPDSSPETIRNKFIDQVRRLF